MSPIGSLVDPRWRGLNRLAGVAGAVSVCFSWARSWFTPSSPEQTRSLEHFMIFRAQGSSRHREREGCQTSCPERQKPLALTDLREPPIALEN